jgi:hypothetical protein
MRDAFANSEPRLVDCRPGYVMPPGFSFFFDLIRRECNGLMHAPLHRICSLMRKMGVQCFVREELLNNAEINEEKTAVVARTRGATDLKAVRLSFFREFPGSGKWQAVAEKELLGYAVVAALTLPDGTRRCYILEAVTRVPSLWVADAGGTVRAEIVTNYYVHCCRDFETVIGTAKENRGLRVTGSFFCQQNDLTHVCAHAALRMGINSSPAFGGPKLTNKQVNDLLGIDHRTRKVGRYPPEPVSIGLSTPEILHVVQQMGWEAHVADFVANPAIDYEDFIYPMIESGFPTILGIHNPVTAHVLAVLGHTLNTDRWTPEARHGYGAFPISPYISTSAWTDHFIVSDDNFGMYVTLGTESIRNLLIPKYNPNLHASLAIGLVPSGVTITGYAVEQVTALLASKIIKLTSATPANRWMLMLQEPGQKLVCRTMLSEKAQYVEAMKNALDERGQRLNAREVQMLESSLPTRFWLTEITVPHLYSGNKRKLGDIISSASVTPQQYQSGEMIQFCWLPGMVWNSIGLSQPPQGWSIFGHIPLLRGAAQTVQSLEW